MDTKLKKTKKVALAIITLCILIPAFLLVACYPQVSDAMLKKRAYYQESKEEGEWFVDSRFINYAMETSYYVYGKLLAEASPSTVVDFSVLDKYGWISDYSILVGQGVKYNAEYVQDGKTYVHGEENLETRETFGAIVLQFDASGILQLQWDQTKFVVEYDGASDDNWRTTALRSVSQYNNNVSVYERDAEVEFDEEQVKPKNFKITFALSETSSNFVWYENYMYYMASMENLMAETGAIFLPLIAAVFVFIMALIFPFDKKVLRLPFEVIVCLGIGVFFGAYGMYYAMGETCLITDFMQLEFLGIKITSSVQWAALLVLNFLGWSACFFGGYVVISSLRELALHPIAYFRERILCVRIFKWLFAKLTTIDLRGKWKRTLLKLVLLHYVVLIVGHGCICIAGGLYSSFVYAGSRAFDEWCQGVFAFAVYSILLYIVLYRRGEKLQRQYLEVLSATEKMGAGDLKTTLSNELGLFQPIGDALRKVQEGFSAAVVEEAKSQNMKTELITNVSHDLKTPLTAIITYVDLLKNGEVSEEERQDYIQILDQKSQRLKVLIEDLFEVSKAQSGNVKLNFMEVDVVNLMKQVKSEMEDRIENSNLIFRWNLPDEKILLSLDGQRTYRVFENLLNNILKYAMPASRVYIDISDLTDEVRIVFRNVSAKELYCEGEYLTERFVRGDESRQSEGSGLGLAIAKSFTELQNGTLNIEIDGDLFKVILIWNK